MKRKKLTAVAVVTVFIVGLAVFLVYCSEFSTQKPQLFSPHYLLYQGIESKIYAVSETTSYRYIDSDYNGGNGLMVTQGSGIFSINVVLRNDYSSDNPPPTTGTPVSPIDGTAYITLKAALFRDHENVLIINLSPSDFDTASKDQTGLVLASGQTGSFQLAFATNHTRITGYSISLYSIGDSLST